MAKKRKKVTPEDESHESTTEKVKRAKTAVHTTGSDKPPAFNPHVDGKGPSLEGCWKEQIAGQRPPANHLLIACWNVNGFRAICKAHKSGSESDDFRAYIDAELPDIICLNETKLGADTPLEDTYGDYKAFHVLSRKAGYAGVAVFVKQRLASRIETCIRGIGNDDHDAEGRTITLVFAHVCLVVTYVVNAGEGLKRLKYRIESFDKSMHQYLRTLHEKYGRSVVWTGDLNCAREEIDIWNSKANAKTPGHTKEERDSLSNFLENGEWVDVWRTRNPKFRRYTFWPARSVKSRVENLGWRLDYFILSRDLVEEAGVCEIRDKTRGSDHCPIVLSLPQNLFVE